MMEYFIAAFLGHLLADLLITAIEKRRNKEWTERKEE